MKKILVLMVVVLLAAACAPSDEMVRQAIYQTQTAEVEQVQNQPTKIPTASPTNTPEPVCELTSELKSEWLPALCDTFDNNETGWWYEGLDESELASVDVSVRDGQYIIDVTGKPHANYKAGVVQWFSIANAENFLVSIDGKISSKNRGVGWGFNFRGSDNNFYSFVLGKEGWYYLDMLKDGEWYYLIKTKTHKAINWDDANNLTLIVENDKFYFYVNGTLLETYDSDVTPGDEISLLVTADEGASATFYFDNVLLKTSQ